MTERLYYTDSYVRTFRARVTGSEGDLAYLDRSAFYPASGGQPFDTGRIGGIPVVEVIDEGERLAHRVTAPVAVGEADCEIDWERRFDHMQQHTGQHLLSAMFVELYGFKTISFHLGADYSTIDLDRASLQPAQVAAVEDRVNREICANRPVAVSFEHAAEALDLRKPSEREGTLRIVSIEGLDRSACGGTHLRSTGEIGSLVIRKLDRVRNTVRVEFLCGARAVRRARADFEALTKIAQMFSSSLDDAPAMVSAFMENARAAEKAGRKIASDLAVYQGRELYANTAPGPDGVRRMTRRLASGTFDDLRAIAQSFTAQSKAVFTGVIDNPPSLLLAVSEDSGVDAGKVLKAAIAQAGGRGGGNARMAQGSVPAREVLDSVLAAI